MNKKPLSQNLIQLGKTVFWVLASLVTVAPVMAAGDHGASCETATILTAGEWVSGSYDFSGDQDYFRIDLPSPGILTFDLLAVGSSNLRMQLLGPGCLGASSTEYVERSDMHHVLKVSAAGSYFVKVLGHAAVGPAYQLRAGFSAELPGPPEELSLGADAAESCLTAGEAETILFDGDRLLNLTEGTSSIDSDIIIVRLTFGGFLEIEAEGAPVVGSLYAGRSCGPDVQLRGDVGLAVGEKILAEVAAGEYFLRLAPGPGSAGSYQLHIAYLAEGQ